ncbi:hypothetical protein SAMN05444920_118142 [Nonomuraea solani]|uniref:Peptidase inhibitor family I36 n=1 Tax=Nonomuraea solani TaxID=1144553 RepID=A0A1H6EU70_9ACTN|nr:hypothetical protein [Nonomuraea solani]SEH00953.1 hypothetical protein SAMN05444920_118142 [Nonomuraea solani]
MHRRTIKGIAVAALVTAASFSTATPASAGQCTLNACGVVINESRHAAFIGEWCGNPGKICSYKVLMPGEHSQKYFRDTDGFNLQCDGVVQWGYGGSTSNQRAHVDVKISDFNTVYIRYQGC